MMKKRLIYGIILLLIVITLFIPALIVSATEASLKESTEEPFSFLGAKTYYDIKYYINAHRDSNYKKIYATAITFEVFSECKMTSSLSQEIDVGFPVTPISNDTITLLLKNGYEDKISFKTPSEGWIFADTEFRKEVVFINGDIVFYVEASSDDVMKATYEIKAYFKGTMGGIQRIGRIADGKQDVNYNYEYDKENNQLNVNLSYRLSETGKDQDKFVSAALPLRTNGNLVKFNMMPISMKVLTESGTAAPGESVPPANPVDVEIDTNAKNNPGEVAYKVLTMIVTGLAAAGLAIAAGGATESTSSNSKALNEDGSNQEDKLQPTYKMYIGKDFGDTLRYNEKLLTIYARIVEVSISGVEKDRPDLSAAIDIFTQQEFMVVSNCVMVGTRKCADIGCISKDTLAKETEGVVSFEYNGKGGRFRNNMTFRLAGDVGITIMPIINLLSSEQYYDLPYELLFCGDNPQINFNCPSGLIKADLTVGIEPKKGFIRLMVADEAKEWNGEKYIKEAPFDFEVVYGLKANEKIVAGIDAKICYECLTTVFDNCDGLSTPEEIKITTGPNKDACDKGEYILPLMVTRWDKTERKLILDKVKIDELKCSIYVKAGSGLTVGSEYYNGLVESLKAADIKFSNPINDIKPTVNTSVQKALRCCGKSIPDGIPLIITLESDVPELNTLTFENVRTLDATDYRAMIRWFLGYANGKYIEQFIKLGEPNLYNEAIDYIKENIWPRDNIPWSVNSWGISNVNGSFYEDAYGDIMRKPYIALDIMPTGIGDYTGIGLLYHELTHTLEDIKMGERGACAGSERHTFLLNAGLSGGTYGLSTVSNRLIEAETLSSKSLLKSCITQAIQAYTRSILDNEVYSWLPGAINELSNFGAYCKLNPKQLFYHYANDYTGPNADLIKEVTRSVFCPIYLNGTYVIKDGTFKGAKFTFKWHEGVMTTIKFTHNDYEVENGNSGIIYEWIPDKNHAIFKLKFNLITKITGIVDKMQFTMESLIGYGYDEFMYKQLDYGFTTFWKIETTTDGINKKSVFYNKIIDGSLMEKV